MKIHVTRELIGYALQQSNSNCAIALALKEADPNIIFPRVTHTTVSYTDRSTGQRYTFDTPKNVAKWIDEFDRGKAPSPFTATIEPASANRVRPIRRDQPSVLAKKAEARATKKVQRTDHPRSNRPLREV